MSTLVLTILSNVCNKTEVFNHLIQVRREDTGEEGLLLCSHCCRWPAELIGKATWIEGCYTPAAYKDDSRLLMGYHPRSITKWSVEGKTLTLTIPEPSKGGQMVDVDFYPPVPRVHVNFEDGGITEEDLVKMFPQRHRYIRGLWEQAGEGRGWVEQVLTFFRMVDASSMPLWVKRMAVYHLDREYQLQIITSVEWTRDLPDLAYCEEYADGLKVVVNDSVAGYAVAERIGLQADMAALQNTVIQYCNDTYGEFPQNLTFNKEERDYVWKAHASNYVVELRIWKQAINVSFGVGRLIDNEKIFKLTLRKGEVELTI